MIVDRIVFSVKLGHTAEAVELFKEEIERYSPQLPHRIYFSSIGQPANQVVFEGEFENEAESEKFWTEWVATPEADIHAEKRNKLLTESGWTWERWGLAE
jgi:hypothetical protein